MDFLKEQDYLKKKFKKLKKYTTFQEKEVLLMEDDATFTEILAVLSDVEPLNETEAAALILKLREISVSDLLSVIQECKSCNQMNSFEIEIEEFFDLTPIPDYPDFPIGIFHNIYDVINTTTYDNLILSECNNLKKILEEQANKVFVPFTTKRCRVCGTNIKVGINPKDAISKSGTANIYTEYLTLSYYTHMTKLDVDSMFPYERELFLNLLKEKLKESPAGNLSK